MGHAALAVKNDQVADAMVPLGLPFTMLSNAFVPTGGMTGGCASRPAGTR